MEFDFKILVIAIGVVAGIAILMGLMLAFADSKLKVQDDPRAVKIAEMLPGYNCGACGQPGCSGLANAIVEGKGSQNDCKPASPDAKAKIAEYRAAEGI